MNTKKFTVVALALTLAGSLISFAAPVKAANTTFLTDKNGNQVFPMSPPTRSPAAPGAIDNMAIGVTTPALGRFSPLQLGGALPTIASGACGTTTNGAVVAGSTNNSGQITIGAAATTACPVSFNGLTKAPKSCTLFPMNAAAAATGTTVAYVSALSAASFTLTGSALANANYAYQCF